MEAHKNNDAYNALVGNQASSDFDEAIATCNWLPSVLDNGFCSLNASVNEDILENGRNKSMKITKNAQRVHSKHATHQCPTRYE